MSERRLLEKGKQLLKSMPILGPWTQAISRRLRRGPPSSAPFPGSIAYWEGRYAAGGNSGVGSYGKFAEFKAAILNAFVAEHGVKSVVEFGCGDGNQLALASYASYLGVDVSETAIERCRARFASECNRRFVLARDYDGETAELALSLDVIYHLVEDQVFETYMRTLFAASSRYVIIYASDSDDNRGYEGGHVRHRKFTRWVRRELPPWKLVRRIPNKYPYRGDYLEGCFSDFFLYARADDV